jgi:hypothetical protein
LATDGGGGVGRELERERRVVAVSVGAAVVLVVLVVRGFGRVSFSLLRRAFARGGGVRVDDGPHRGEVATFLVLLEPAGTDALDDAPDIVARVRRSGAARARRFHTPSEIGTDPSGKSGNRRFFVTE